MIRKRTIILTLIMGFSVTLFMGVVITLANLNLPRNIFSNILISTLVYTSPVIGGIVVGYVLKKKGWYYGLVLGIIELLVSVSLPLIVFIYPVYTSEISNEMIRQMAQGNILKQLMKAPLTLFLYALGGHIGEYISKKRELHA
jgi:MFS family permease